MQPNSSSVRPPSSPGRRWLRMLVPSLGALGLGAPAALAAANLDSLTTHAWQFAATQLARSVAEVADPSRFPRSTLADGTWKTETSSAWTSGFFPGGLWLEYEKTGNSTWRQHAASWTLQMESQKNDTSTHDVGFKIFCSFGNSWRLLGSTHDRDVVLQAAHSLSTRYSSTVGCIRSWNNRSFPVIIDNMMNLEILFWAAKHGGESGYYDMAVSHALKTRQNHVRPDGSTYHLVDYDPATGAILSRGTVQGYSDASTWARGQAWALYGFTMAYRETNDARFLETACLVADWFVAHLPADRVPYWDFQAPGIPNEEKDSSAGAIAAAGLFELSTRVQDRPTRARYRDAARAILTTLAGSAYLAEGSTSRGLLRHGVGNHPNDTEVDVSLVYGDYYFLQALSRYAALPSDAEPAAVRYRLAQNAPNPFNPTTRIDFELPGPSRVVLRILDAHGREVRTLVDDGRPGGLQSVVWDGRQANGRPAPSGVYFYEMRAGEFARVEKMTLIR